MPPSALRPLPLPELLAPAGDWECAKAAVENGADAIYFALEQFNARMRARNFNEADLPKLMEFLHRRGVRGYACLNTLVFEDELAEAEQQVRAMIAAGVDAVLVQDVGIARLVRQLSPDFPLHASTQMTITSAAGVAFARDLGCDLVVLARELSLKDIARIQSSAVTRHPPLPLEVFVHGALCIAYSGQCLTSAALGGRSANRGECAQACRLPYTLICDGKPVPLGDRKYLLSPQDLAGLDWLPELVRLGVASLKIEGRLKRPEYVANITRIYRQALDQFRGCRREEAQTPIPETKNEPPHVGGHKEQARYEMEMAFSRGLHTGWLLGPDNQALVHGRFGKKRGVYLGEITKVLRKAVIVKLEGPLKPGDGVVFDGGKPEETEEGGRVYEVRSPKSEVRSGVELRFGRGDIDFSRVRPGDKLWKTDDPELNRRLRQSFAGDPPRFQQPIAMEVHGQTGQPLTLIVCDELGHGATVASASALASAENQPLTTARLCAQLGRLGGTPFRLDTLRNHLVGDVLLPVSELNRLRRQAVAELERQRAQPKHWMISPRGSRREAAPALEPGIDQSLPRSAATTAELIVLVRNLAQLEAALKCGVTTVYCDFENPAQYRDGVTLFRAAFGCRADQPATRNLQPSIWVAPPRIFKPGEEWILRQVRAADADGYLVRNHDHLQFFASDRRRGDYSLNVANRLAAAYFKDRFGLERLTVSYDLNLHQLEALLRAAPPEWFEVTIHQHLPMFHMEHCAFCAFLARGKDHRDCGRPCDRHNLRLRDRVGAEHPVKADSGCRNTVFHARAQTGAEHVERLRALGARHFRLEFLDETPDPVARTIAAYRQLLRGEISGTQLGRELKLFNQLGVTRGPLTGRRA